MCNLYSITKGQQAIRELYRAATDSTGNLPSMPGVFPDYSAPIVRNGPDGRELVKARWGMPSPVFALQGKRTDPGVTNIRNVKSPHWRRWLGVESRCLVPFSSFSEHEVLPDGRRPPVWFALVEDRPLACFAAAARRATSQLAVGLLQFVAARVALLQGFSSGTCVWGAQLWMTELDPAPEVTGCCLVGRRTTQPFKRY